MLEEVFIFYFFRLVVNGLPNKQRGGAKCEVSFCSEKNIAANTKNQQWLESSLNRTVKLFKNNLAVWFR